MLVENTREEALKAFVNGSDVRVLIETEEMIGFPYLSALLPQDAIYFIDVDIHQEDDYEEKVLRVDQGGPDQVSSSAECKPDIAAKPEAKKQVKRKSTKDIIEPYIRQGLTDPEIANITGIKYRTVWEAARKIRKNLDEAKGRNADRHLCETCQYRACSYNKKSSGIKCEYALKPGTGNSRGCAVEDCDKYVEGKPLKAKDEEDA